MITWQYIAGFFDGEGNVNYHHAFPNVNISQTASEGRAILEEIRGFLMIAGFTSNVHCYPKKGYYGTGGEKAYRGHGRRNTEWNNIYRLDISNRDSVVGFLEGVKPYVHVKKVQVQDCLRYAKAFPKLTKTKFWQDERVNLMRAANPHLQHLVAEVL